MNKEQFYSPELSNSFTSDPWLVQYLKWRMPDRLFNPMAQDLSIFGQKVVGELYEWSQLAEEDHPRLSQYDGWGNRTDRLKVAHQWQKIRNAAAIEGFIDIPRSKPLDEYSRLYQMAKLYLFHPSSAFFTQVLSMTDASFQTLDQFASREIRERSLGFMKSKDPIEFWTAASLFTEPQGGSEYSDFQCVAKNLDGFKFQLFGQKNWTTFAAAEMGLVLAKLEGQSAKSLSLFYVESGRSDGRKQNFEILRMRNKMVAKGLPLMDVSLAGIEAWLVGEVGHATKQLQTFHLINRIYSSVCATAQIQRGMAWLYGFSVHRIIGGRPLIESPLFREELANCRMNHLSSLVLSFYIAELMGKEESDLASQQEKHLLRLMVPLTQVLTSHLAVMSLSQVQQGFGGFGLDEDSHVPALVRDSQIFSIWDGTPNVLSLELLKVLNKDGVWAAFDQEIRRIVQIPMAQELKGVAAKSLQQLQILEKFFASMDTANPDGWQVIAKELSFAICHLLAGARLLEWTNYQLQNDSSPFVVQLLFMCEKWWSRPHFSLRSREQNELESLRGFFMSNT